MDIQIILLAISAVLKISVANYSDFTNEEEKYDTSLRRTIEAYMVCENGSETVQEEVEGNELDLIFTHRPIFTYCDKSFSYQRICQLVEEFKNCSFSLVECKRIPSRHLLFCYKKHMTLLDTAQPISHYEEYPVTSILTKEADIEDSTSFPGQDETSKLWLAEMKTKWIQDETTMKHLETDNKTYPEMIQDETTMKPLGQHDLPIVYRAKMRSKASEEVETAKPSDADEKMYDITASDESVPPPFQKAKKKTATEDETTNENLEADEKKYNVTVSDQSYPATSKKAQKKITGTQDETTISDLEADEKNDNDTVSGQDDTSLYWNVESETKMIQDEKTIKHLADNETYHIPLSEVQEEPTNYSLSGENDIPITYIPSLRTNAIKDEEIGEEPGLSNLSKTENDGMDEISCDVNATDKNLEANEEILNETSSVIKEEQVNEFLSRERRNLIRKSRQIHYCRYPTNLKTSDVLCKRYPSKVRCTQKCIFGYTLKEGIRREMECLFSDNKWKPIGFEECRPFVDCTMTLISSGKLSCFTPTTVKAPTCNVTCDAYEDKPATSLESYECRISGSWSRKLPFCVVSGSGLDLVPAPRLKLHPLGEKPEPKKKLLKTKKL